MSTVFRLDASIRGSESVTRSIADTLESELTSRTGSIEVIRRDVARHPLDPRLWALTQTAPLVPGTEDVPERAEALRVAAELADEVESADAYILATPFYNFGVSQHVKAWVDMLLADARFRPGTQPSIAGRPGYLIIARGGGYGPGTPRHGWDHGTDWLRRIFGDVLGLDVHLIESELTLAPITPGMEDLRELADTNLRAAHRSAGDLGRSLADRLRIAA